MFAILVAKFAVERASWTYYLYAASPCAFWSIIVPVLRRSGRPTGSQLLTAGAILIALALQYIGYTQRWAWTVALLVLAARPWLRRTDGPRMLFSIACVATSIFPLLPVEKGESIPVITLGALCLVAALEWLKVSLRPGGAMAASVSVDDARLAVRRLHFEVRSGVEGRSLTRQASLTLATAAVATYSARSLQLKLGLPLWSQMLGWACLGPSTRMVGR